MGVKPFFSLLIPHIAYAQSLIPAADNITGCTFRTGELSAGCIPAYIGYFISILFLFVSSIFLISIMIAGYQIAFSGLTDDKQRGKNRLIGSMIGFFVAMGCYLIVDLIVDAVF
jgi:hypothetical protein